MNNVDEHRRAVMEGRDRRLGYVPGQVQSLRKEGKTLKEIAASLGMPLDRVRRFNMKDRMIPYWEHLKKKDRMAVLEEENAALREIVQAVAKLPDRDDSDDPVCCPCECDVVRDSVYPAGAWGHSEDCPVTQARKLLEVNHAYH